MVSNFREKKGAERTNCIKKDEESLLAISNRSCVIQYFCRTSLDYADIADTSGRRDCKAEVKYFA